MAAVPAEEQTTDYSVFSHQVQCDINFLESRLNTMRAQHNPNQQVIRTYENMLQSRMDVLSRLQDEGYGKAQAG